MKYVEVAIDNKSKATDMLYTYRCPFDEVAVGSKVYVPFGLGNRLKEAYVFAVQEEDERDSDNGDACGEKDCQSKSLQATAGKASSDRLAGRRLKAVQSIDQDISLTEEMLDICSFMRHRYLCKYIDGINCFTPPAKPKRKPKGAEPSAETGESDLSELISSGENSVVAPDFEVDGCIEGGNPSRVQALQESEIKNMNISEVNSSTESDSCYLINIKKKDEFNTGEDIDILQVTCEPLPDLTEEQQAAVETITEAACAGRQEIFLLNGVTASGKTEVYMRAIADCLTRGRTAIMMVPEIALSKQVTDRFTRRFGEDRVAVMHSGMSKGKRYSMWQRIRRGQTPVVVGARSAVFAPLENLGLVIMDEEHETSYKSDMTPKYDTVDIALKRVMKSSGVLVLGSATPSVVSTYRAQTGIYKEIRLRKRYNSNPLPEVSIVDMRRELAAGNREIFSRELYSRAQEVLSSGRQLILFLNRRGYRTFISCRDCGHVMRCPVCGISLTYHKDMNAAVCHYCGHREALPQVCPECGSVNIRQFGAGTEKLEEDVARLFEDYPAGRLDADTISRKGALDKVLKDFRKGRTKILIGTQLVAKGLDFDNVGLVGIISADQSLNIPDFRSAERTFQLITQAAGRAGRGSDPGRVIIQTYDPDSYAIRRAAAQDYDGFYRDEIRLRQYMNYPPFSDIIQVIFSGKDQELVSQTADMWYAFLMKTCPGSGTGTNSLFRPQPAPMNRIHDTYRYSMLIRSDKGSRSMYLGALGQLEEKNTDDRKSQTLVNIDINPYSFL